MRTRFAVVRSAVLLLSLVLYGTAPQASFAGRASGKEARSDDTIYNAVLIRLASDADVKGGGIQVEVKDGVVTLKGRVGSDHIRSRAQKLARHVKGVTSVDNELTVGPPEAGPAARPR